jgi:hypothetical protein
LQSKNFYIGIQGSKGGARGVDLRRADGIGAVENLALQVREIDVVRVGDGEAAQAARREIQRRRATKAAGADDQRARGPQPLLPFDPDLGKKDVAAVAEELLVVQLKIISSAWGSRRWAWCWRASAAGP